MDAPGSRGSLTALYLRSSALYLLSYKRQCKSRRGFEPLQGFGGYFDHVLDQLYHEIAIRVRLILCLLGDHDGFFSWNLHVRFAE